MPAVAILEIMITMDTIKTHMKSTSTGQASKSLAPNHIRIPALGRHFLSKQELALAIGVSPRTIDNWMAQKRIPFLRLSARLIKFNLERVKAALARYEIKEVGACR
jgi:excisionase family DNA binding protein